MSYFRKGTTFNVQTGAPQSAPTVISLGNAVDWARAEASLVVHGPVPEEVFQARLDKCQKCPQLVNSDENPDAVGWCAACGCGTKARAALSVKLTMPKASCPRQEWGEFKPSVDNRRQDAAAKAETAPVIPGAVGEEEYQERLSACRSCPHLDPSSGGSPVGWCKACGCGKNARAELSVKARMPEAKCPEDKWPRKDESNA